MKEYTEKGADRLKSGICLLKNHYEKHQVKYRLLSMLIITIWLSFSVFKTDTVPIPIERLNKTLDSNNETYLVVPKEVFDTSNPSDLTKILWKLSEAMPYGKMVCFENKDTYLYYNNYRDYGNITVLLSFNKGEDEVATLNKTICHFLPRDDDKFTFQWLFNSSLIYPAMFYSQPKKVPINETHYIIEFSPIKMHPSVTSYLKLGPVTTIFKLIMLFFTIGALLWTWSRAIIYVRDGIK